MSEGERVCNTAAPHQCTELLPGTPSAQSRRHLTAKLKSIAVCQLIRAVLYAALRGAWN